MAKKGINWFTAFSLFFAILFFTLIILIFPYSGEKYTPPESRSREINDSSSTHEASPSVATSQPDESESNVIHSTPSPVPADEAVALFKAFDDKDYDLAKKMVEKNPQLVYAGNEYGRLSVKDAVRSDRKDLVQLFLSNGVDPNLKDMDRVPLLNHVVADGNVEIVGLLVDKGARVNPCIETLSPNYTSRAWPSGPPPHTAVLNRESQEMAQYLLSRGADINAVDSSAATAFHLAVMNENSRMAYFLIGKGAKINTMTNDRVTPLHFARDPELSRFLIDNGADVNAGDKWGNTPLHYVPYGFCSLCFNENYPVKRELTALLLSKGASINAKNLDNQTPLHGAATYGYVHLTRYFLQRGAKADVMDSSGKLPINYALEYGPHYTTAFILLSGWLMQNMIARFLILAIMVLVLIKSYRKYFRGTVTGQETMEPGSIP